MPWGKREMMGEIELSAYGLASQHPAPVNAMMAAFAADFRVGYDINLGVGYVDENTIPKDRIREALEVVLSRPDQYRAACNYGGPRGSPNLIRSLRHFHCEKCADGLTEEILAEREIIVGPNGATSLLEGIAQVLRPGIVLTADPRYYIYCNFLERLGYEVVSVPEDKEGIRTDLLRERLADLKERRKAISFFYLVSISNPTSTILSNRRRQEMVEIATALSAELGRRVPLIVDAAYELLVHDPQVEPLLSPLVYDEAGVVYQVGTLSKILAPSLRIGYLIGKGGGFLEALVQKTSDAGFSAPLLNQEIASHLLERYGSEQVQKVNQGYREKALRTRVWIAEILGEAVEECRGGQAGFYFYLTLNGIETGEGSPFFRFLSRTTGCPEVDGPTGALRPRVVYLPGQHCVHPRGEMVEEGKRQLRLSYGFEELGQIRRALEIMREGFDWASRR